MTARLVALMAFVLFLCLGAFSLLLRTSRENVILEAQTSLRATSLKTLAAFREANLGMLVRGPSPGEMFDVPVGAGDHGDFVVDEKHIRIARGVPVASPAAGVTETVDHDVTATECPQPARIRVVGVARKAGATAVDVEHESMPATLAPGEFVPFFEGGPSPESMTLENVWVSTDENGDKLRDKYAFTLMFTGDVDASGTPAHALPGAVDFVMDRVGENLDPAGKVVQFSVDNGVDTVFQSAQQQSVWWFVGVLALGVVLSAGLARRFTRPIRDLDGALRRLSNGDLDVTVDVTSKHEVGRLQSAFNAMATRLKKSRELELELHRREKLTALGRLAAGVAHDVRNPLHSIQLTLDHLSDTARPAAEAPSREFERGVRLIRGEIERLDRLVEDFLCFARSDVRRTERVDVAALLADVAQFVAKEAQRRSLAVVIEATPGATALEANPESLRSSLLNLVLNGFEAMDSGGTLTLRAAAVEDGVVLEVEDTGRGIAHEDRERVFEFGFTTRTDGHGLGLAMVHQIVVEEHGGRVQLESTQGVGTRVRIELPARVAQEVA